MDSTAIASEVGIKHFQWFLMASLNSSHFCHLKTLLCYSVLKFFDTNYSDVIRSSHEHTFRCLDHLQFLRMFGVFFGFGALHTGKAPFPQYVMP